MPAATSSTGASPTVPRSSRCRPTRCSTASTPPMPRTIRRRRSMPTVGPRRRWRRTSPNDFRRRRSCGRRSCARSTHPTPAPRGCSTACCPANRRRCSPTSCATRCAPTISPPPCGRSSRSIRPTAPVCGTSSAPSRSAATNSVHWWPSGPASTRPRSSPPTQRRPRPGAPSPRLPPQHGPSRRRRHPLPLRPHAVRPLTRSAAPSRRTRGPVARVRSRRPRE